MPRLCIFSNPPRQLTCRYAQIAKKLQWNLMCSKYCLYQSTMVNIYNANVYCLLCNKSFKFTFIHVNLTSNEWFNEKTNKS